MEKIKLPARPSECVRSWPGRCPPGPCPRWSGPCLPSAGWSAKATWAAPHSARHPCSPAPAAEAWWGTKPQYRVGAKKVQGGGETKRNQGAKGKQLKGGRVKKVQVGKERDVLTLVGLWWLWCGESHELADIRLADVLVISLELATTATRRCWDVCVCVYLQFLVWGGPSSRRIRA